MAYSKKSFSEDCYFFHVPEDLDKIHKNSLNGQVPYLETADGVVSDSLVIGEYMAEMVPELWPSQLQDRTHARMICALVHSGLSNLRSQCGMNLSNRFANFVASDAVKDDIRKLEKLLQAPLLQWQKNNKGKGSDKSLYLYDKAGIVDAYLTPIAARVYSFDLPVSELLGQYLSGLLTQDVLQTWLKDAREEIKDYQAKQKVAGAEDPGYRAIGNFELIRK